MDLLDKAIKTCDTDVVKFSSEKEAIEYCKWNGINLKEIKAYSGGYFIEKTSKKNEDPHLYEYEYSIYANWGENQEFIGKKTFTCEYKDAERARKEINNTLLRGTNRNAKHLKLIKIWK